MVFFTCNACGESLKKNAVEKHYLNKCRNCEVLTCIDCHKDFPGDSYQTHVKCITEDEKYGGKGWTAKANANKGEKKQQAWIDNLQALVSDPGIQIDSDVRGVLDTVMNHENIPRKRQKFLNFVKNIRRGVRPAVIEKTWEFFEQALKPKEEEKKPEPEEKNGVSEEPAKSNGVVVKEENDENEPEEESKQGVKMFKGTKEEGKSKKKKDKKRKREEIEEEEEAVPVKMSKKEKKAEKRRRLAEEENQVPNGNGDIKQEVKEEEKSPSKGGKFSWDDAIAKVLAKKGGEPMKVEKVKKLTVALYLASPQGETNHKSEDDLRAKVEKKLNTKKFVLLKGKVKLKEAA